VRGPSPVRVEIFDMASRSVRVVQDGTMASGRQEITWDGRDGIGNRVGSGAYLCVFSQGLLRATKTLLLEHQ
jgi:flagellar hook assembly protein FlgD